MPGNRRCTYICFHHCVIPPFLLLYLQIIGGALQLLAAFGPLVPKAGVLVGALFSVISRFFYGPQAPGGSSVMQQLLDMRYQQLTEMGAGVAKALDEWATYMNSMTLTPTSKEIDDLVVCRTSWDSPKYLGELMSNIKMEKSRRKNVDSAKELLQEITLYCALSGMRELLLYQMVFLISSSQGVEDRMGTVTSIESLITKHQEDSKALEFLHRPDIRDITVASVYTPVDYPEIAQYLKHLGIPDLPYPARSQLLFIHEGASKFRKLVFTKVLSRAQRRAKLVAMFVPLVGQAIAVADTIAYARGPACDEDDVFNFNEVRPGVFRITSKHNGAPLAISGSDRSEGVSPTGGEGISGTTEGISGTNEVISGETEGISGTNEGISGETEGISGETESISGGKKDISECTGCQGSEALWRIIMTAQRDILLSPVEAPDRFLYMMWDAGASTWHGDPGIKGHWMLDMIYNDQLWRKTRRLDPETE